MRRNARPAFVGSLLLVAACGPAPRDPRNVASVAEVPRDVDEPAREPAPSASRAPGLAGALAGCTATVLDARVVDGCLEIPVSIGGHTGWMVADTGATYSAVARGFVAGLPSRRLRGGEIELADLRFADLLFERVHLVPRDGAAAPGSRVGAIGTDFLSQYIVVLDWDAAKVALVQRSHAEACTRAWTYPYVDVHHYGPEPRASGPPLVPVVRVESVRDPDAAPVTFDAQLDSGSCETEPRTLVHANAALATVLRPSLALRPEKVVRFLKGETGKVVRTTFFAPAPGASARVGEGALGPFFVVEHPAESRGPYAAKTPLAVLGTTALRALGPVAVDPFQRRLWRLRGGDGPAPARAASR